MEASRNGTNGGSAKPSTGNDVSSHTRNDTTMPIALQVRKRGRSCVIGKLVVAEPLAKLVLAIAYRHRPEVEHVSLPQVALDFAREHGVGSWLVRLDARGECYSLDLASVDKIGWLHPSEGKPGWFVPLDRFERIGWQDWPYVEETLTLEASAVTEPNSPHQLPLFQEVA